MNELVREALRRYRWQRIARSASVSDWAAAVASLQAKAKGASKFTRYEIEAEIAVARRRGIRKTISRKPE